MTPSWSGRWQQRLEPTDLGLPGPSALDMARGFRSIRRDPLSFLTAAAQRYGDLVAFPVPGPPVLLVNDPGLARQVLQTSARTWGKQTVQYAALARVTGPGLLASAEPNWIEHRRIAAPAFHHQRLAAISDQVAAAARDAVDARLSGVPTDGRTTDAASLVHGVGLDAVGRALFSADLSDQATRLLAATSDAAGLIVRLGRSVLPGARWAPTRTNARLLATRRRLDAVAAQIIAVRRAGPPADDGTRGADLLGLLLDSGLPDDQIRDELVTMVVAGHETVAAALSWTLMLLAEHPQAQERARAELTDRGAKVSMVAPRETLPWTRAVIDEALRLYPPAWVISRRSTAAERLGDLDLPAGTLAIISPWTMHRRPQQWADPSAFTPERFLDRASPRSGYLPFGQGPRLCIGREFALGEMVLVLHEILRRFRVELPAGWTRPPAQTLVAVHPRGGMPLRFVPVGERG